MRQSIVIDKQESRSKPVPFLRAKLAAASHTQASRLRVTTRVVLGLRLDCLEWRGDLRRSEFEENLKNVTISILAIAS